MQTQDGKLIVIAGKSRSGKTAYVARDVKGEPRIIAWDPEDQWSQIKGFKRITSKRALYQAVQKGGAAKLAYVAGGDLAEQFNFWAGCAYHWGRYFGGCVVIGEELADVTSPSKACGNWGILLRRGLKRNITIYPISQRWAEADKTALGNPSEIVCFSMMPMDVRYMASKTGINEGELAAIKKIETDTTVTLPYIRLFVDSGDVEKNKLQFKKTRTT